VTVEAIYPVAVASAPAVATGVFVVTAGQVTAIVGFVSAIVLALYGDILKNRKADRQKLDACEQAHQTSNDRYIDLAREVSELTGREQMAKIVTDELKGVREEIRALGDRK
jgi:uncharacterized membrane protein (DUF106 family)